jgi:hypothetical protein
VFLRKIRVTLRALTLIVIVAAGCARHAPSVATRPESTTDRVAERISNLTMSVSTSRAKLDSVVLELHRQSGDTSAQASPRFRQLIRSAAALDSTYRSALADLERTVSAATAASLPGNARFPVDGLPSPLVRAFSDGGNWILQSPVIYELGKKTHVVIVPRGFVTDFASIPKPLQILRGILPTSDRYGVAALVHDYLYWRQDCTREQADNIMEIAMMQAGVSLLERKVIREGVRQFGQSAWDANRKARESGLIRTVSAPHDLVPLTGTWPEYREWLRTVGAKSGLEYRVAQSICDLSSELY